MNWKSIIPQLLLIGKLRACRKRYLRKKAVTSVYYGGTAMRPGFAVKLVDRQATTSWDRAERRILIRENMLETVSRLRSRELERQRRIHRLKTELESKRGEHA